MFQKLIVLSSAQKCLTLRIAIKEKQAVKLKTWSAGLEDGEHDQNGHLSVPFWFIFNKR